MNHVFRKYIHCFSVMKMQRKIKIKYFTYIHLVQSYLSGVMSVES